MRRTLVVVAALMFAGGAGSLQAQNPGRQGPPPAQARGGVLGSVVDAESGEAIVGASVAVRSQPDSAIVTGAIVREDGAFQIPGLAPGTYYLQVTSLGYTSMATEPFTISEASPRASVGTVRLAPAPIEQEGIEAVAARPQMLIEPDRNSYRAKDVAPAATSASEVLESIPAVQVDADGKVSLRGNENVAVQINGRPAPVRGDQLGAYLRQLPAGVVERVEVVPTPSARYDPEGMAGIINIVMKSNVDLGTSGGFTLGAATEHRFNAGANLGYQRGPLTLFTSYGFNSDERTVNGINDRLRYDPSQIPLSFTEQDIDGDNSFSGHNLSTNLDYRLGERDVLSTVLVINRRSRDEASLSDYTELDGSRTTLEEYARGREGESKSLVFDATLAFKRTIEARLHELSTEVRFNRNKDDDQTDLWRQPATSLTPRTELEDDHVDALTRRLDGQLDYTRPLTASLKLETGYKGSARWLNRDFLVLEDSLGTGTWVQSDLSNAFEFDEQIHAAYGVLSQGLGKWELQAGLRGEHASQDFVLSDESFPHTYNSLFPSGVVLYNHSEATQAKIAYSRRIRRPGTQELNPFPVFMDPQNAFIGNPELKPEYTDAIELGLTRNMEWGQLQLSPFYRRTTDVIRFIVDTDAVLDGRQVTTVSFENLDTSNSYGTDLNASVQLGQRLNGFASFNVFKMVTDGGSVTSLSSDAVTWSARLNGTTQLTPNLSLQAQWFYRAPMNFENGRFSAFQFTNITLRQKLMGERASVSLRVADPFKKAGFHVETGDDNILQITDRRFNARALHLTFQYNFGQAPKVRPPRQEPAEPQAGFPQ
jgi:outer membrane receptor protein involved in Fe transport